jgi:hypothetical protein
MINFTPPQVNDSPGPTQSVKIYPQQWDIAIMANRTELIETKGAALWQ